MSNCHSLGHRHENATEGEIPQGEKGYNSLPTQNELWDMFTR